MSREQQQAILAAAELAGEDYYWDKEPTGFEAADEATETGSMYTISA